MIKEFFSYYKPHKKLFIIDMFCSFLFAACSLVYPKLATIIANKYIPSGNIGMIFALAGVLVLVFVFMACINFVIQYWGHILGVRIQGDMRSRLFGHLQRLPFSYFDEHKTGSIMSRITNDLFEIAELAHHGPEDTFISLVTIIGAFIILMFTNVLLTLIVFAIVPLMLLFAIFRRKAMMAGFTKAREKISEINAGVESSISGIRVAKAYTASGYEQEKFEKANNEFKLARGNAYKNMGIFFGGMSLFRNFLYLVSLVAAGVFYAKGKISEGDFLGYILYINILLQPISTLVAIFEQIQDGMTGFKRYREILAVEPEAETANALDLEAGGENQTLKGDIEFKEVSFSYQNKEGNTKVIRDLSLKIESGKTVALVGPSGGGKTTLCHLLPRFYEIDGGEILIDGFDNRSLSRRFLRSNIGIVAQDVFLFSGTIRDNIAYGRIGLSGGASEDEIIEASKRANIHDFIMSLPKGYDSEVGERGVKLSGGQKQRISIARAFLKNPPILIFDEATSALDNVTEMQIQASLEELSRGRTTIVVAHRLSTVKNCDEILVLTGDGIAERGSHAELMAMNGFYAHLYSFYTN